MGILHPQLTSGVTYNHYRQFPKKSQKSNTYLCSYCCCWKANTKLYNEHNTITGKILICKQMPVVLEQPKQPLAPAPSQQLLPVLIKAGRAKPRRAGINLSAAGVKHIIINQHLLQVTFMLQVVNCNDLGAASGAVHAFMSCVP